MVAAVTPAAPLQVPTSRTDADLVIEEATIGGRRASSIPSRSVTLPRSRNSGSTTMADAVSRLNAALSGRYRIEREIGVGGMATVYLADDLRHERKVALKVLKPELAAVVGADRFLTEIKTTANLQHPHILPLHDSGEADGFLFYVMPYVDGESLRERLDRERQLPVDEAVLIARNVAEALDYAHTRGVIHRDIKPANILLQSGKPVVSDFGIALAVGAAGGGRLTETGLSLGTPHYMSPEQATGDQAIGPAADVFALGCVLYEMLTGEPPFTGGSAQAVLGRILTGEAPSALEHRRTVPANVDACIRRALEKVPADRFQSARNLVDSLNDPHFRHGRARAGTHVGRWKVVSGGLTAVATVLAVALAVTAASRPTADVGQTRFTIPVDPDTAAYLGGMLGQGRPSVGAVAISPGGDRIVYAVAGPGEPLRSRRLGLERAMAMEGTEGARAPFFSPDGDWIGFVAGDRLLRVPADGGAVEEIAHTSATGAAWGDDDTIVLARNGDLFTVPATGGQPERLAVRSEGTLPLGQPHVLPGSEVVLAHRFPVIYADPVQAQVVAFDRATGRETPLIADASHPLYVPTGHLLFMRRGTLMAAAFDASEVRLVTQPVALVDDVMHAVFMPNSDTRTGVAQVGVSGTGHLVYARGGVLPPVEHVVVRVTAGGAYEPLGLPTRPYHLLRLSPNGARLAFQTHSDQSGADEIWVRDLESRLERRLDTGGFGNWPFEWSPSGDSLVYSSDGGEGEVRNLYRIATDGSGPPVRVTHSPVTQSIASWSVDGVLAWIERGDIWIMPPGEAPAPFFTSDEPELYATFSPDGRWLAYAVPDAGVYVRPYPGPGPATQVANDGCCLAWSGDGARILYIAPPDSGRTRLMAVEVTLGDQLSVGPAAPWVDSWRSGFMSPVRNFDLFSDGAVITRVVPNREVTALERYGASELHVWLNFAQELRARFGR